MPSGCTIPVSLAAWTYPSVSKCECTSNRGVRAGAGPVMATAIRAATRGGPGPGREAFGPSGARAAFSITASFPRLPVPSEALWH